jgi:uncharacterized Fe-S center protein
MSAASLWFTPMRDKKKRSLIDRVGSIVERAGIREVVAEGDLVAVKVHFGELGNTAYLEPHFVREIVARVKAAGGRPFLTDANTLYRGQRANAVDHIECALKNGFAYPTVEAPVIIADGLTGHDWVEVPVPGGKHFDEVRLGAAAMHADAMIVVSHVKGHEASGFGGAIKNVGMGLGSRSAKQRMHADFVPVVDAENCTECGRCVRWCPVDAIELVEREEPREVDGRMRRRVASIDLETCYGCGECVASCPYGAIATQWADDADALQEKMVEHAAGVLSQKPGKVLYVSFVNRVTPDCDCWNFSDAPMVPDIGVLAGTDMVAIDQAAYDLVVQAVGLPGTVAEGMDAGEDKFRGVSGIDGTRAMRYAETLGLGTRGYEIHGLD